MVSLLILKYVRNLIDENLVDQWAENIYFQYFSGEQHFQPWIPCVPTELVAFRQRIGEPGMDLIIQESIRVNEPPDKGNLGVIVSVDTTVQEKNITYHTDDKLYKRVLTKKRSDSDKIYSLHEPNVKCYSKGKEHKKYEFGSKASLLVDQGTGIILGAINFTTTLHDSKTIPEVLEQFERLNGKLPAEVFADRGNKGIREYKSSVMHVPKPDKAITKEQRSRHSRMAAIEPVIGHLKSNYRLCRNYLKGIVGDNINVILAAAAMNFKRRMNLWRTEAFFRWSLIFKLIVNAYWGFFAKNQKLTF